MGIGDYIGLLEHLPKVGTLLSKLLPLLEGKLGGGGAQNTAASEELRASQDALRASVEGLRAEVGSGAAAQASLYRQLNEQSEQMSVAVAELRASKAAVDAVAARLDAIEKRQKMQTLFGAFTLAFLIVILVRVLMMH